METMKPKNYFVEKNSANLLLCLSKAEQNGDTQNLLLMKYLLETSYI